MFKWLCKAGSRSSITLTGLRFLFQTLGETALRSLCVFNVRLVKRSMHATRQPATRHQSPATRHPFSAKRYLPPATREKVPPFPRSFKDLWSSRIKVVQGHDCQGFLKILAKIRKIKIKIKILFRKPLRSYDAFLGKSTEILFWC